LKNKKFWDESPV